MGPMPDYDIKFIPKMDVCQEAGSILFTNFPTKFLCDIQEDECGNLQCLYNQVIRPALINFHGESVL